MSDTERLCWFCKHFYFSPGERGYSEMTPGSDTQIECYKGLWAVGDNAILGSRRPLLVTTPREFRDAIHTAETCKHWSPIEVPE